MQAKQTRQLNNTWNHFKRRRNPVNQNVVRTRLPKLSLPKFRGYVTKWNTFWDSFQSAVHRNEEITNIDKFNYLKSVLEGSAARAIEGLTLQYVAQFSYGPSFRTERILFDYFRRSFKSSSTEEFQK